MNCAFAKTYYKDVWLWKELKSWEIVFNFKDLAIMMFVTHNLILIIYHYFKTHAIVADGVTESLLKMWDNGDKGLFQQYISMNGGTNKLKLDACKN